MPTSESTLLLFVSYLASRNLSYPTIKVYLAGIRSLHVVSGHDVTFHNQLTPRLHQVLKGIRKEKANTLPLPPPPPYYQRHYVEDQGNIIEKPT